MLAVTLAILIIVLYFWHFRRYIWFNVTHASAFGIPGIGIIYHYIGVKKEGLISKLT